MTEKEFIKKIIELCPIDNKNLNAVYEMFKTIIAENDRLEDIEEELDFYKCNNTKERK